MVPAEIQSCGRRGREGDLGSGVHGFACDSLVCNQGDVPVAWLALPQVNHPVFTYNMYRLSPGGLRLEQIGQSWIKHSFAAAGAQDLCDLGCIPYPEPTYMGVGCSDVYSSESFHPCAVGPRSVVNPFTGAMPGGADLGAGGGCSNNYPSRNHLDHTHTSISHVVRVADTDLTPALNPDDRYFVEVQYISPHEFTAAPGNQHNNVTYREFAVLVNPVTGEYALSALNSSVAESPALFAWTGASHSIIEPAQSDGRAWLSCRITDLGNVTWHYEYAIYNMNLDRSISSLRVPVSPAAAVTNIGFRAPLHHPPEPNAENYSNAAWVVDLTDSALTWSTGSYQQEPLANAVRWGTLYNFWFDADSPPTATEAVVEMFKTGETVVVSSIGPTPPIPSASGWGMAMMTLAVLLAGTLMLHYRRHRTA